VCNAKKPGRLQSLMERGWVRFSEDDGISKIKPWTDDYINIIKPLMEKTKGKFF
jgi:hypothetical protein